MDGLNAAAVVSGEPVFANDPSSDPRSSHRLPTGHPALRTFLGLPLFHGRECVGSIGLANREGGYDEAVVASAKPLFEACAQIIERLRAERRLVAAKHDPQANRRSQRQIASGHLYPGPGSGRRAPEMTPARAAMAAPDRATMSGWPSVPQFLAASSAAPWPPSRPNLLRRPLRRLRRRTTIPRPHRLSTVGSGPPKGDAPTWGRLLLGRPLTADTTWTSNLPPRTFAVISAM